MRRVFAIGETVFDIIFKDNKPVSSTPGGSMLNAAVSLGRLGMDVYLISEYGNDRIGEIVNNFLNRNGIKTEYVQRYEGYSSSLALAFLNRDNNADYCFYKNYPEERLTIEFPELTGEDIVVYGSFYGIDPGLHAPLKRFLLQAKNRHALIVYDPNFRVSHLPELEKYRNNVMENFDLADIIKGSDEDFAHIFGTQSARETWSMIQKKGHVLVYTANKNDVHLCMPGVYRSYPVPPVEPVSTVGAGDTFNAGLVYSLAAQGIYTHNLENITETQCSVMIENAIKFAGHVCTGYDNYISQEFADRTVHG